MRWPYHVRLEPRRIDLPIAEWAVRLTAGLGVALLLGVLLLVVAGYDPVTAYTALLRGAVGSSRALSATLNKAVPIGLCAIGIALAYRAGLWNIGAEGQLYFGAFAATGLGLALPISTPVVVALASVLIAGLLAGAIWAAVAAVPRAYLGTNEILATLMLNHIAILWVHYLVDGPWADPIMYSFPYSKPLPEVARLGKAIGSVHWGIAAIMMAAVMLSIVDRCWRWGYELRVLGDSRRAAQYGSIAPVRTIMMSMVVAGAVAGLAGAIEVSASIGRLQTGLSPGYGFMAILVAWLSGGRPLGIVAVSILYASLLNGGFSLQVSGIPPSLATILQATLLLAVLSALSMGRYRIRVVRAAGAQI